MFISEIFSKEYLLHNLFFYYTLTEGYSYIAVPDRVFACTSEGQIYLYFLRRY